MNDVGWRFPRLAARAVITRRVELNVSGLEHVPARGPAIVAARHYHHLYDGCALLTAIERPLSIVVTLEWIHNPAGRRFMEAATSAAGWPVVARTPGPGSAATNRRAVRDVLRALDAGRIVVVFPEGYPTIDPGFTPKSRDDELLPFSEGAVRFARSAGRRGLDVPLVPAGFSYARSPGWRCELRFGAPRAPSSEPAHEVTRQLEQDVRRLSGLPPGAG